MNRITRALAALLLLIVALSGTGCLHTLTQTYADYPPSALEPPYTHPQGNPSDG
jgi:hypothetical protein